MGDIPSLKIVKTFPIRSFIVQENYIDSERDTSLQTKKLTFNFFKKLKYFFGSFKRRKLMYYFEYNVYCMFFRSCHSNGQEEMEGGEIGLLFILKFCQYNLSFAGLKTLGSKFFF